MTYNVFSGTLNPTQSINQSVTATVGLSVVGVAGPAGDTDGWPVTCDGGRGQTLSGTGARVYTAHSGRLGVAADISAASTGGRSSTIQWAHGVRLLQVAVQVAYT